MNTQEMINKAKEVSNDRKAYGIVHKILLAEIEAREENYFESPYWQEHEKIVLAEMKVSDKRVRTSLEGLIL